MPESNNEGRIKARLVVSGFVQGLGYRAYVKQVAYRSKVRGTVKNLPDGGVEIYCSAPSMEVYNRFKEMIRSLPDTEIDGIEEYFVGTDGYGKGPDDWVGFNILRDDLSSVEESLEYVVLGGRQMLTKQDQMLTKQDETLEAIKDMHHDLKKDMKETHHGINDSITDMHQDMNERFDWLEERYGEFGETMRSINEKLDKISQFQEDFHEMKGAFIKLTEYLMNKHKQ